MIISYDFGHGTGQDRGANGVVNEEIEIRKYGPVVVNELMRKGHTLINCTPTTPNMSLDESLSYRTTKANTSGSQLHICFHVNAFKTTSAAMGAEVEVASDAGANYGQSVLKEIAKLGFINRGVKRPSLYVTGHTNMTAILIEPFFCDSSADVKIYDPNTLGSAIATGIINIIGGNSSEPVIAKSTAPKTDYCKEFQMFFNKVTQTAAPLTYDGYGPKTQAAIERLQELIKN
jgi:N-acetylmuramoyl-L-alanine amidase